MKLALKCGVAQLYIIHVINLIEYNQFKIHRIFILNYGLNTCPPTDTSQPMNQ